MNNETRTAIKTFFQDLNQCKTNTERKAYLEDVFNE